MDFDISSFVKEVWWEIDDAQQQQQALDLSLPFPNKIIIIIIMPHVCIVIHHMLPPSTFATVPAATAFRASIMPTLLESAPHSRKKKPRHNAHHVGVSLVPSETSGWCSAERGADVH